MQELCFIYIDASDTRFATLLYKKIGMFMLLFYVTPGSGSEHTLSYRCQSDGDDLWLWDLAVWKISVIFADIYPPLP